MYCWCVDYVRACRPMDSFVVIVVSYQCLSFVISQLLYLCFLQVTTSAAVLCMGVLVCCSLASGDGAGRAFPVQSENYAIQQFRKVNQFIVSKC